MQPLVRRGEGAGAFEAFGEFAEHETVGVALDRAADLGQASDVLRQVAVVQMPLQVRAASAQIAGVRSSSGMGGLSASVGSWR